MTDNDPWRVFHIGGGESEAGATVAEVGAKAANLARLDRMGLRVPPALALTTALFDSYREQGGRLPDTLARLAGSLRWLEDTTGLTLGGTPPLLLSVRSSPGVPMPGILDAVLNVGLTEKTVRGLIRRTGLPTVAWDCYRRLARSFAECVHHAAPAAFDALTATHLARAGARCWRQLDPIAMRELARASADLLCTLSGAPLPPDPVAQVARALEAVFASWNSPRACAYRRAHGIEQTGTAVLVQAMVLGNGGARSGSGVGSTRNPATGDRELYLDFAFDAQGPDVVSGHEPAADGALSRALPDVWTELQTVRGVLEYEFHDMQDFTFTVEDGRLYFLESRADERTPWAAARVATDLVASGIIDSQTALQRLAGYDMDAIARASLSLPPAAEPLARATGVSFGVAAGGVAFDPERAAQLAANGPVILLRSDISDDAAGVAASAGIVTTFGGRTSPVAVCARQLGKVALVGCADLRVDAGGRSCLLGAQRLREGDVITIDGATGFVYAGRLDAATECPGDVLATIESWRRSAASPIPFPRAFSPEHESCASAALVAGHHAQ